MSAYHFPVRIISKATLTYHPPGTEMPAPSNLCSVLYTETITLPGGETFDAHLIDPFLPLLRGYSVKYAVTCLKPPTAPYISARKLEGSESGNPPPTKRAKKRHNPIRDGDAEISPPFSFSGKARKDKPAGGGPGVADPRASRENKGAEDERAHHATIKIDIALALNFIRSGWSTGAFARGHQEWWQAGDGLRWKGSRLDLLERAALDDLDIPIDWAGLTKAASENKEPGQVTRIRWTGCALESDDPPRILDQSYASCVSAGVLNGKTSAVERLVMDTKHKFVMSPRATSLFATIEEFASEVAGYCQTGKGAKFWDLVVIDPPWDNASAARSSSYNSIELYDLFKMDLPRMLGENMGHRALIMVWVTNRPKFRRFLKTRFLPDSHVEGPYAEWYWTKITGTPAGENVSSGGEALYDLESQSPRRCYEGVVLGWYTPPSLRSQQPPPYSLVPAKKVFLSVPLGHSRKPDLQDLLRPYLSPERQGAPNVLELFSRTVGFVRVTGKESDQPIVPAVGDGHYLSVGNEAMKFNGTPWIDIREGIRGPV